MAARIATGSRPARGFTYLSLLFFVAMLSVGLAATAVSWQTSRQREKEEELLFAGAAIREAISLYYGRSPGGLQEYPKRLGDLLQDPRFPDARRYLRRIYRDPMTNEADWITIAAPDGGIMGVHSRSTGKPIKVAGEGAHHPDFSAAASYADWQFVYLPEAAAVPAAAGLPPATDAATMFPPVQSIPLSNQ
ncbi:MAG TPA: type II secretion system protein [Burkholderiales bacterium]|nr:type II secretion system protein [Burkholderiales bacterium]